MKARLSFCVLTLTLVLAALPGVARAHATLQASSPAADAIVQQSPSEIVLTFSEPVDRVADSIRLLTATGERVNVHEAQQTLGSDTLVATVPALAEGTYVVSWRALSADSHPISGAFTFAVGRASTTDPNVLAQALDYSDPDGPVELALGMGRWASYLGFTVAIGLLAILAILTPDLLAARRSRNILTSALLLAAIGTLAMIAAQAVATGGRAFDPGSWIDVWETRSGRWWFARLAAGVLVGAAIALRARITSSALAQGIAAVVAVDVLAVIAAGGHASTGEARWPGFIATVLHLAAVGLWIGGLVAAAVIVPAQQRWGFAARLSPVAFCCVILLTGTGFVNAWRQLGSFDALTGSSYGRWLIAKLVVVGSVIAVAGVSRWLVRQSQPSGGVPTGARASTVGAAGNTSEFQVEPALRRSVILEVIGMILIVALTAGLVNSPPPRASAATGAASASAVQGDRIAQIILDPPVTGGTTMHVEITGPGGALDRPDEIIVEAELPAQGIGPIDIPVFSAGPTHVTTNDADLPLAGTWRFTVAARYGEFDQTVFVIELEVR